MESSHSEAASGRAYEKVIRYVQEQIVMGNIRQGQRLPPERELAELLQVGRNSVREALRTLSLMGFISSTQGSGNYVSCNFEQSMTESMHMLFLLNQIDYLEVSELRQGIETQAVLLAAQRIQPEALDRLRQIVSELGTGTDEQRNSAIDKELHYIIASASGNRLILQVLQSLSYTIDKFISNIRGKILLRSGSKDELQRVHEALVDALCAHDSEAAVRAMRAHFSLVDTTIAAEMDTDGRAGRMKPTFFTESRL